jgi:hypothetical protein
VVGERRPRIPPFPTNFAWLAHLGRRERPSTCFSVFIFQIMRNEPRLLMILILSTPRKPALRFARHSSCTGDLKPTLCCAGVAVNANGEYAITASTGGGGHSIYVSSPFLRNILDTFRNTNIRDRDPPYPVPSYSSFKLVLC